MTDAYQLDIFGHEIEVASVGRKEPETIKGRFRKMYGFDEAHACRDCAHRVYRDRGDRRYYKCELIGISASESTDIRLKDPACGRWARREDPTGLDEPIEASLEEIRDR